MINLDRKVYDWMTPNQKREITSLLAFDEERAIKELSKMKKAYKKNEVSQQCYEPDIKENLIPYYENCVRKLTKWPRYSALDGQGINSRNWIHFCKVWSMLKETGWDYEIFIDAQFEAFSGWEHDLEYPPPHTLYSDRAKNAFKNYVLHQSKLYKKEGWSGKLKSRVSHDPNQELEEFTEKIGYNLARIANNLNSINKNPNLSQYSKEIRKAIAISWHWDHCQPEYLALQDGFFEWVGGLDEYDGPNLRLLKRAKELVDNRERLVWANKVIKPEEKRLCIPCKSDFIRLADIYRRLMEE